MAVLRSGNDFVAMMEKEDGDDDGINDRIIWRKKRNHERRGEYAGLQEDE